MAHTDRDTLKQQARQLNQLINVLSLYTRRIMVEWLPQLESETGITEQRFMVMWELNLQPNVSLKALANTLVVSPSSLSVMITSMVEQGYVARAEDPADRRRVLLHLTEQGAKELAAAESSLEKEFAGVLQDLNPRDREALASATQDMLRVMVRVVTPPEQENSGSDRK